MTDITDGVPEFVAVVEAKGFRAALNETASKLGS